MKKILKTLQLFLRENSFISVLPSKIYLCLFRCLRFKPKGHDKIMK